MANNESKQMIVGLDIGTSKVVAVVGEINSEFQLERLACYVASHHPEHQILKYFKRY